MMKSDEDVVLNALIAAAKEVAPALPEGILRSAYAIERRHQFDRTDLREASLHELQRLLEEVSNATTRDLQ